MCLITGPGVYHRITFTWPQLIVWQIDNLAHTVLELRMLENGYASFQHFKKDETGANTKQQKVDNSNQLTF